MSVSPSVVVRGVVVLSEECVEAPVVGEEGAVAVAEVPLAHQVRPVAALPPQHRGQRGEAAGGRGEVRAECVKTTSPGVEAGGLPPLHRAPLQPQPPGVEAGQQRAAGRGTLGTEDISTGLTPHWTSAVYQYQRDCVNIKSVPWVRRTTCPA